MSDIVFIFICILGIILVIFLFDSLICKRYTEEKMTKRIVSSLRKKNHKFYEILPELTIDKGIVIVINDTTMIEGMLQINTLKYNKCKLGIMVFYTDDDINPENLAHIKAMGIKTKNLREIPEISKIKNLHDDQKRAFALVYAPFKHVILVEPDVLFFTNPEYLFNDQIYQKFGAIYWKDRELKLGGTSDKTIYTWIRKIIPYSKKDNKILEKKSGTHQSRSLILFNKTTHVKTLEKIWVLAKKWNEIYSYIKDSKEIYWIASELAKDNYFFVPFYPGVIGELYMDHICGNILHLDMNGNPLFWENSLFRNSNKKYSADFTHISFHDEGSEWSNLIGKSSCLLNSKKIPLTDQHQQLINEYAKILHDIRNELE